MAQLFSIVDFPVCGRRAVSRSSVSFFLPKTSKKPAPSIFCMGGGTLCYYFLVEDRFRNLGISLWDCIWKGIGLGEIAQLSFNAPLWFLPCFFITQLAYLGLYKLLERVKENGRVYCCLALTFALYAGSLIAPISVEVWSLNTVPKFLFYYACGAAFQRMDRTAWNRKLLGALFIVSYGLSVFLFAEGKFTALTTVFGVFGTLCLSLAISKCAVLEYVGARTLTIMVLHGPVYRALAYAAGAAVHLSAEAARENWLTATVVLVLTILACIAADGLIQKAKGFLDARLKA